MGGNISHKILFLLARYIKSDCKILHWYTWKYEHHPYLLTNPSEKKIIAEILIIIYLSINVCAYVHDRPILSYSYTIILSLNNQTLLSVFSHLPSPSESAFLSPYASGTSLA